MALLASAVGRAEPMTCGDADDSGAVTVTDGVQVLRAAAGLPSLCTGTGTCDVDAGGTITVTDGVNVLRAAAGLSNACQGTFRACGGVAGLDCPPGEQCVDIPGDGCDPVAGGADCPGICEPTSRGGCAADQPCPEPGVPCEVCADGSVACPITFCDPDTDECRAAFQECPATVCGGVAGSSCPAGERCIDDPRDGCDPKRGGADCAGLCVREATPSRR